MRASNLQISLWNAATRALEPAIPKFPLVGREGAQVDFSFKPTSFPLNIHPQQRDDKIQAIVKHVGISYKWKSSANMNWIKPSLFPGFYLSSYIFCLRWSSFWCNLFEAQNALWGSEDMVAGFDWLVVFAWSSDLPRIHAEVCLISEFLPGWFATIYIHETKRFMMHFRSILVGMGASFSK